MPTGNAVSLPPLGKRATLATHAFHQLRDRVTQDRHLLRVGVDLGLELNLGMDLPARGQLGGFLVRDIFLPGTPPGSCGIRRPHSKRRPTEWRR